MPGSSEAWRSSLGRLSRLADAAALKGPRRLAKRLRAGAPPSPLALALLAAITLHLLVLAAHQLRQRRQPAAVIPPPRDDTPELLQFSRQQNQEPALAPLSIAALAQLPPPPPPPLTPTTGPAATPKPVASRRSADQRRATPPPGRSTGPKAPTARSSSSRNQTSSRPAASSGLLDPALESALAALTRWQSRSDGRAHAGEAGWPAPQKPEAEQLALWTRLWEKATPGGTATGQPRRLPAGVELRRLVISESEAEALPEERRLSLALGDRFLLIWSTAGEVWLLQAPASRPERDGNRPES